MGDERSAIPNAAPDLRGHTPAPWRVRISVHEKPIFWVVADSPEFAAGVAACGSTSDYSPCTEANANLIAAAPDLLEAILKARNSAWMLAESARLMQDDAVYNRQWDIVHECDRAIAKATGRIGPRETPSQQERSQP